MLKFIRSLKFQMSGLKAIEETTLAQLDKEKFVNNREYCRVSYDDRATFRLRIGECITSPGPCYILDILAGGAKISTDLILPTGPVDSTIRVILEFKIEESYTLEAEIIWAETVDGRCNYGCKWVSLKDIQREQLFKELHRFAIGRRKVHW